MCGFEKEEKKLKKETGGFWDEYNNRGPGFVLADKSQCPPGRIRGWWLARAKQHPDEAGHVLLMANSLQFHRSNQVSTVRASSPSFRRGKGGFCGGGLLIRRL